MEDNNKQKEEVKFPGMIEEKHMPGTYCIFPCPHCFGVNFDSPMARDQHLKDYHKVERESI